MSTNAFVYVNGQISPAAGTHLSALDRGFTLGDGVFETFRSLAGKPIQLAAHLRRLRQSAAVIDLPVPFSEPALTKVVADVIAANNVPDAAIRLTITRGVPAERGLLPTRETQPTLVVQASPFHPISPEKASRGLAASLSTVRRNEHSPVSRIKSCNYLDNVLAKMEAHRAGVDEAIMLNTAGLVACCSASNIFVVNGEVILTPAIECGVLEGVTRAAVHDLALRLGLRWEEGRITPAELAASDEVFATNSLIGVVALTSLDGSDLGRGHEGPATGAIRRAHEAMLADSADS